MGIGEHVRACAEEEGGNQKRDQVTCRARASRAPSKADHEDKDDENGKSSKDHGWEIERCQTIKSLKFRTFDFVSIISFTSYPLSAQICIP